jgi:hypothetical protein
MSYGLNPNNVFIYRIKDPVITDPQRPLTFQSASQLLAQLRVIPQLPNCFFHPRFGLEIEALKAFLKTPCKPDLNGHGAP